MLNPASADDPVVHTVIFTGASQTSEMLRSPLEIMMRARRQTRLDFVALLGMPTAAGEWTAASKNEVTEIVDKFRLRVGTEAVLAAAPFVPRYE